MSWIYVIMYYLFEGELNLCYNALFIWRLGWVYVMIHHLFGDGDGLTL